MAIPYLHNPKDLESNSLLWYALFYLQCNNKLYTPRLIMSHCINPGNHVLFKWLKVTKKLTRFKEF